MHEKPLISAQRPSRMEFTGLILGIETATTICSVGLATAERVLAEINFDIKHIHDQVLTEAVAQLFRLGNFSMPEVRAIAVSSGPGSFTGLRIGMSVAKGLAFTHNKPMIGVSTLLVQAYAALAQAQAFASAHARTECLIVPLLSSRRNEIYAAEFESATPLPILKKEACVHKVADFAATLAPRSVLCGNGIAALQEAGGLDTLREQYIAPLEHTRLSGGLVARVGQIKFLHGEMTTAEALEPHYVQDFETGPVAPRMPA